jgi:hypothetical protein
MPKVSYFKPDEMVFHLAGDVDDASIGSLIQWAQENAPPGVEVSQQQQPPIRFPPPQQQSPGISNKAAFLTRKAVRRRPYKPPMQEKQGPFTLVVAKVSGLNEAPALLKFVLDLDKSRKKAPLDPKNPLQVVALNWNLSGGPSTPGGTGGPGARPDPYTGPANTTEHNFRQDTLPENLRIQPENGNEGAGVVVAVLDTAPTQPLDAIYERWVELATEKHSLLESLRDHDALQVETDPFVDIPSRLIDPNPPGLLQSEDHDYEMSDHGLFVAGIIHSLAKKAKIHLFQVLNRYGVGDLASIARGLEKVISTYPNGNLVVNMSLTLEFPLEEAHITTEDAQGRELGLQILSQKRPWLVDIICRLINLICMIIEYLFGLRLPGCEASWFERQALPLLSICRSVNTLGSDIIAAAGNKRKTGYRPQALYPAAFPDVLGVGALPKYPNPPPDPNTRLATASYSNFSDSPEGTGIATFGGEPGPYNGILGIYLREFPAPKDSNRPATESTNGWAWWCGTSFATAVMTGMTANTLSNMSAGSTPRDAVNQLITAHPYFTREDEEVLFVTQC